MKELIKKMLGIDAFSNHTPLKNLVKLGFVHGAYHIPENFLTSTSVCYCIGAGIDISFDTELVVLYDSNVFIFDPMPEGKNHYKELVEAIKQDKVLTVGEGQPEPFNYRISKEHFNKLIFVDLGIWDTKTTVKFYEPTRENYVSHSILNLQKSDKYIEANVDRLSNIMADLKHPSLDLVKIEIEGAEYKVIETIIKDKLDVKIILVEYDEVYNHSNHSYFWRIKKSTDLILKAGYKMAYTNANYKRTFVRNDVFELLNA